MKNVIRFGAKIVVKLSIITTIDQGPISEAFPLLPTFYSSQNGYRLDFLLSFVSDLRSSPKRDGREFVGRSAGTFLEQRLVIEPRMDMKRKKQRE